MPDAFLDSELSLEIRAALAQVDRLNEAVHRATTGVRVTADVRQVTAAIDAAIDAADANLQVTSDARSVTASIDAAVEASDTQVTVTGDAAEVTGAIDAAVENADTNVSVTGSVDPGLAHGAEALGDSLDAAATSGVTLQKIVAGLSVGAAVAGLRALADAASDLQESTGKAQVVFGDFFDDIDRFAAGAAQTTGLAKQEALEAAGTFGNLFQALGQTQAEAARLSPDVVQLAADLASFNNLGVDEVLEKIRSGLVGEVEPLRSLGVSFLAADVNAKGLALGLGDVNGVLSEGEKVQARYALILEQTTLAQGDYARTADGLANSQRTLQAELGNAAAAAGQMLLPAFSALIAEANDAIPGLNQLAENVLPAIGSSLEALAPLIGTTVDLLVALSPIVQVVATAIGLIPAPVIQAAGALLVMNKALALTKALTAGGLGLVGTGGLSAALNTVLQPAAGVSGVLPKIAAGAGGARAGLAGLTKGLSGATLAAGAGFLAFSMYQDLMADAAAKGEQFGADLRASFDPATASLEELRAASANLDTKIADLSGRVDDSFLGRNGVNRDFNASLREGIDQAEQFQAEIDAAADAMVRAAAEAEFGPLISQLVGTGDALQRIREDAPQVASAISGLRSGGTEPTARSFLDLATTIDGAALSEEQMADAAALLGTDVDALTQFVETAREALATFADTASAALPQVADAFGNVGDDGVLSLAEFTKALKNQTADMVRFVGNLQRLTDAGFAGLAGIIAEQGPEVAGALAAEMVHALDVGNEEVVQHASDAVDAFTGAWQDTTEYLKNTLGPEFVLTTGLIGANATMTFGENLSFDERLRIAGEVAALEMDAQGKAVAAIAATEGASAARRYGDALGLDAEVVEASVAAGVAITRSAPVEEGRAAGASVGDAWGEGFVDGIRQQELNAAFAAQGLTGAALLAARKLAGIHSPSTVTMGYGEMIGEGLAVGLERSTARVIGAARSAVGSLLDVVSVARPTIDPFAPSGFTAAGSDRALTLSDLDAVARVVAQAMPESLARDIVLHYPPGADPAKSVARELQSLANRM